MSAQIERRRSGWRAVVAAVGLFALASGPSLRAALEFERAEIEVAAKPGERELTASFPFRNAGAEPVDILDVATSCGCLSAEVTKRDVAPGEKGTVAVRYTVGTNEGLQIQRVTVLTTAEPAKPTTLIFRAQLPRNAAVPPPAASAGGAGDFQVTPNQLTWLRRPFEMKPVVVEFPVGREVKAVTARCEPENAFECAVKFTAGESRAIIEVRPRAEAGNEAAELVVGCERESGEKSERRIPLRTMARKTVAP